MTEDTDTQTKKHVWRETDSLIKNKVNFGELIKQLQLDKSFDLTGSDVSDAKTNDKNGYQQATLGTNNNKVRFEIFQYADGHFEAEVMVSPAPEKRDSKPEDAAKPFLKAFEKIANVLYRAAKQTGVQDSVFVLRKVSPKEYAMRAVAKLLSSDNTPEDRLKPENERNKRFNTVRYDDKLFHIDKQGIVVEKPPLGVDASALLMPANPLSSS